MVTVLMLWVSCPWGVVVMLLFGFGDLGWFS